MKSPPDPSYRHRFPAEIVSHAVWPYYVFSFSLRDVGLLLAERDVIVSYDAARRWCQIFAANFVERNRRLRLQPGDKWLKMEPSTGAEAYSTISRARLTELALCSTSLFRRDAMPALRSSIFRRLLKGL